LRDILDRKQINVVSTMLAQWCTNVTRSKVDPRKDVAAMIRNHFDGIVACTQTRKTDGFIEAINGLFQAAKRKARGYTRFHTMKERALPHRRKTQLLIINPHAAQSTPDSKEPDLACAMLDVVVRRTGELRGLVFENRDIRAMVRSLHWD
jgi:hypothetical protein